MERGWGACRPTGRGWALVGEAVAMSSGATAVTLKLYETKGDQDRFRDLNDCGSPGNFRVGRVGA